MVKSSLVGWWPLHEWSGRANDLSGNGNHGTLNGGVTQGVAGRGGLTSYSFDGSDDYIEISRYSFISGFGPYTISAWVKFDSTGIQTVLSNGGGTGDRHNIGLNDSNNELCHSYYDGSSWITAGKRIEQGKWYHIAGVATGNQILAYINGQLQTDSENNSFSDGAGNHISLSGTNQNTSNVDGSIADVRVYDRALSPQEVQHLYRQGSRDLATPPDESDPAAVARYSFDDRSDTGTAIDQWGNNNGTINGAVYSSDSPRNDNLSMKFDGTDDYINCGSSVGDYTDNFSISAWVRGNEAYRIFTRRDSSNFQYEFYIFNSTAGGSGQLSVNSSDSTAVASNRKGLDDGKWHHVGFSIDNGSVSFYIDGVKDSTHSGFSITSRSVESLIGAWDNGNNDNHKGNIDDLRIYSRPLSDSEFYQLYRYGSPGTDLRSEVVRR